MMARRSGRVERTIGSESERSGSSSDREFYVERAALERIGVKRNNRIEIA